jgi:arylsulfatase A-like enzyme
MPQSERKNVLLIMTDQQRWDTLGCYGAPTCRTPHIDGLAARGVRFDAAYCPTSPCSPARAALFTGLYPHHNGVLANGGIVHPEVPNLAGELNAAGYNLGYSGKWHVDRHLNPTDYGFEGKDYPGYGYPLAGNVIDGVRYGGAWNTPVPHYTDYLASSGLEVPRLLSATYGENPNKQNQEMYALHTGDLESTFECMAAEFAIDLLRQFKASREREGKPFFLWVNFWGPHTPCLLPEPYYSMYDPAAIPVEPSFAETWANKPRAHELYEQYWGLSARGWKGWREIVARYWGYVTMIDDLVGRMLGVLRELALEEDTVVLYTTDHGDQMGAHRMIEKGPFAYEESWRLPMIAAHPEVECPGAACDEFVYLHDLFPTLLEMAGVEPPSVPDSQSILDQVLGHDTPTGRESIYGSFHSHILPAPLRFVRTRTHKLVYNQTDVDELYDLVDDPWEMRNLIDVPYRREVKLEMAKKLREHMVRLGDPILGQFDGWRYLY